MRALARSVARRTAFKRAVATAAAPPLPHFETLAVCWAADAVVDVRLNRPDRANAMNRRMWEELVEAFRALGDPARDVRAVILSGSGRCFTSGLDLGDHAALLAPTPATGGSVDPARRAWALQRLVRSYQDAANALADCHAPVIAAVHGACIGGGVDLVCGADIRVASADASFAVREVALGLAADVGTLQRLPGLVGNDSLVRQLAFTGDALPAEDAARLGLLSAVLPDEAALRAHALAVARRIAAHSPVAVAGTKANLNFARALAAGGGAGGGRGAALEYAAVWNGAMLQTADIPAAVSAAMAAAGKRPGSGGSGSGGPAVPAGARFPPLNPPQ